MAALICESCGAPLIIIQPDKLAKCPYCRTTYTLPLKAEIDERFAEKAASLMERARIYAADGLFEYAIRYYDQVLDLYPTSGTAYLGKGLAEMKYRSADDIDKKDINRIFSNYNIIKAMIYLDDNDKDSFLSKLGLKTAQAENIIYIQNWRKRAMRQRKEFADFFKQKLGVLNSDKTSSVATTQLNRKIEQIRISIKELEDSISGLNKYSADRQIPTSGNYDPWSEILQPSKLLQATEESNRLFELKTQLGELEKERDKIFAENMEKYYSMSVGISDEDIDKIGSMCEIPELPSELSEDLSEKVYDVSLSSYHPRTEEEILSHKLLEGSTPRRASACLKRLTVEGRIKSFERDGKTYYTASDISWIFIPEI